MRLFLLLLIVILSNSCKVKQNISDSSPNGFWQQLGYGKIIEINKDQLKVYDICKVGCNLSEEMPLAEIGQIDSFSKDSLIIRKNIKTYRYSRLEKLPDLCSTNNAKAKNPVHNFEVLWNTFNEQYCYFERRNIDWKSIYQKYRPNIIDETSELELYQLFDEMLSSLNDGHVSMDIPSNLKKSFQNLEKEKSLEPEPQEEELSTFDLELKAQSDIANFYCKDLKYHNSGIAKWGMMKDEIAYVQINAMWLLAYYDLPQKNNIGEVWPYYKAIAETRTYQRQDEIDGANLLMDSIIYDLGNAKALVLDLRFNGGGKDEAALGIIGHFVNQRSKIASKKAKLDKGFTNHQNIFLEPKSPNFLKKVYLLTSHRTASAAELATMSTLLLQNFIRIGSNTEGIFSDGLDKNLPNGWAYTLSNEVYEDTKGNNYEQTGVPPDIKINYPKEKRAFFRLLINQIAENGDEAIEKIFELQK